MLLTEELEIKWVTASKQHYIDLGYKFTKIGDLFKVRVTDLSKGSCNTVEVGCDYCDNVVKMEWRQYLNLRGETYCCPECLKYRKKTRDENGKLIFVKIPYRDKDWLYNEYISKDRNAKDIAKECGINLRTLREWISILNIPNKESKTKDLTKDILYNLYRVQHKSANEIAKMYDITDGAVLYWLRKYGIPSFTASEAVNIYLYEKGGIEKARETQSTMENRIKSSCRQRGIAIEDFDGFSTTEQHMARNNTYYKEWIKKVFQRDNYTCQCCGKRGGNLNAHHLYNFAEYENLRYEIDNGITLCPQCHLVNYPNSFHSIYGERNNTPEQLYEYIKIRQKEAV